jgi:hypothetical protein
MFGNQRDSAKMNVNPHNEDALQRHYAALKHYLASSLRDAQGNMKPNRARDKLLRLSVTQFMELSTDVYDELNRREDERLQRFANVPRALPPKQNFDNSQLTSTTNWNAEYRDSLEVTSIDLKAAPVRALRVEVACDLRHPAFDLLRQVLVAGRQ